MHFCNVRKSYGLSESTGGLLGPFTDGHEPVDVNGGDQRVRGRQVLWRLQHHGESPVSAETERGRDSTAAGTSVEQLQG